MAKLDHFLAKHKIETAVIIILVAIFIGYMVGRTTAQSNGFSACFEASDSVLSPPCDQGETLTEQEVSIFLGYDKDVNGDGDFNDPADTCFCTVDVGIDIGDTIGSATDNSILFVGDGELAENNTNLFWDDTYNKLGIGGSNIGASSTDSYAFASSIGTDSLQLFSVFANIGNMVMDTIAMGLGAYIGDDVNSSVALGVNATFSGSNSNVLMIGGSGVDLGVSDSAIFGDNNSLGQYASRSTILGRDSAIGTNATEVQTFGNSINIGEGTYGSFAIGNGSYIGMNVNQSGAIGSGAFIGDNSENSLAIGSGAMVNSSDLSPITNSIAIGSNVSIGEGSSRSTAIGEISTIGTNSTDSMAFGGASLGNNLEESFGIGFGSVIADGNLGSFVIGKDATLNTGNLDSFALGPGARVEGAIPSYSYAAAVGPYTETGADRAMTIGTGVDATGGRLKNTIANSVAIGAYSDTPTMWVLGGDGTPGSTGNVGIGTTDPKSYLSIGIPSDTTRTFLQIDAEDGSPATEECDDNTEAGRMYLDTSGGTGLHTIWICTGAADGWDWITLTD